MSRPVPQVRVLYKSAHFEDPIRPRSSAEFAAVVDEMVAEDDFNNSYATVFFETSGGSKILLGLGVFARKHLGAILYQSDTGEYYTRSDRVSEREVFYSDFGNARYFPQDSEIDLAQVKTTLAALFQLDGELPGTVAWQQWEDTEH